MFLMGLELDLQQLLERSRRAFLTAHASIAIPMFLGCRSGSVSLRTVRPGGDVIPVFALFIGCAMSVTAFPVLARILAAKRPHIHVIRALALACAAIADVTAWVILAFVVAIARGHGRDAAVGTLGRSLGLTAAYLLTMFLLVRPDWRTRGRRR
jgi:Kef-type K+ transport system membrane component KefB